MKRAPIRYSGHPQETTPLLTDRGESGFVLRLEAQPARDTQRDKQLSTKNDKSTYCYVRMDFVFLSVLADKSATEFLVHSRTQLGSVHDS